ncbi:MFS transporter [Mycolicibacterium obuense]|uniref:MFS transporter n=1 Tax=Mycolicibacterium obuense TaxID=1807 RepID=UPI0023F63381|nr:MFS transporter [Mycolicibacterium obuense]
MTDTRKRTAGYAVLVVAAGLNLRHPITSVASTLDAVTRHYGLGPPGVAVLSGLPVAMLAAGAVLAPALERWWGVERTLLGLAALLTLSVALRPASLTALFVGTVVAGLAMSGLSVLVPQMIREYLGGRIGWWSGVFSTSFGVSAAVGAGLTIPLVHATGSLSRALALWALPACALMAMAASVVIGGTPHRRAASAPAPSCARPTLLLGQVTAFFGAQAFVFFAVTGWLTSIYVDRGVPPMQAASLLALASIAGLPGSLGISVVAARVRRQHWIIVAVSTGTVIGLVGVVWAPAVLAPPFVVTLGFCQGATFGLAMALIVLKADPSRPVAPFSAFAQGVGFALAALGPVLLGLVRWAGLSWAYAGSVLIAVVVCQAIAGWTAGRSVVPTTSLPQPMEQPS